MGDKVLSAQARVHLTWDGQERSEETLEYGLLHLDEPNECVLVGTSSQLLRLVKTDVIGVTWKENSLSLSCQFGPDRLHVVVDKLDNAFSTRAVRMLSNVFPFMLELDLARLDLTNASSKLDTETGSEYDRSAGARSPLSSSEYEWRKDHDTTVGQPGSKRKVEAIESSKFYGGACTSKKSWGRLLEQLRIARQLSEACQKEGSAPVYRVFALQLPSFAFADQTLKATSTDVRVFTFEAPLTGKRLFLVASAKCFIKQYASMDPRRRHVYEIIREGRPCKLYFDLEFQRQLNPEVNGEELVHLLIATVVDMMKADFGIECSAKDALILDSTTEEKFSQHLVFNFPDNVLFADNKHAGRFVKRICTELQKRHIEDDCCPSIMVRSKSGAMTPFVDTGVYTKNRAFRLMYSSKFRKKQKLLPQRRKPCRTTLVDRSSELAGFDEELLVKSFVCPDATKAWGRCLVVAPKIADARTAVAGKRFRAGESDRRVIHDAGSVFKKEDFREGYKTSPIPTLDKFVLSFIRGRNNAKAQIRKWSAIYRSDATAGPEGRPSTISYYTSDYRWCENIGREHRSNNVMVIVDLERNVYYQKCLDPECKMQRHSSKVHTLPASMGIGHDYAGGDSVVSDNELLKAIEDAPEDWP